MSDCNNSNNNNSSSNNEDEDIRTTARLPTPRCTDGMKRRSRRKERKRASDKRERERPVGRRTKETTLERADFILRPLMGKGESNV